jgi:hypothetical protein
MQIMFTLKTTPTRLSVSIEHGALDGVDCRRLGRRRRCRYRSHLLCFFFKHKID